MNEKLVLIMGRPKIPESQVKRQTAVWLQDENYKKLKARAKAAGMTYSAYCENILINRSPKVYTPDYHRLADDINRIGNNINQIAKNLNMMKGRGVTPDAGFDLGEKVLEELDSIRQLIRKTSG